MDNVRQAVNLVVMVILAQVDVNLVIQPVKLASGHLNIIVSLAKYRFIT